MQPLVTQFTDRTYRYTQLEREGAVAIFEQQHREHPDVRRYEVVRIRVLPETHWPNGTTSPEREVYPGAASWGYLGFTCFSLTEAQTLAQQLHNEEQEETV